MKAHAKIRKTEIQIRLITVAVGILFTFAFVLLVGWSATR